MQSTQSFIETIGELIGKDALAKAIQLLYALLKDSPQLDEAILQSARYNEEGKKVLTLPHSFYLKEIDNDKRI
jgi:hypothetical protein